MDDKEHGSDRADKGPSTVADDAADVETSEGKRPSHVVVIGTSAGGLEALERFFRALPANTGMAFVVVQHLSLDFKSMMPDLLRRFTLMRVHPAVSNTVLQPNFVYVVVPGKDVTVRGHRLIVQARDSDESMHLPINRTFESLAALGPRGAAIVLSGTGSDGSVGALAVRNAGGLVIAQTPGTARFDGMPRSLIDARTADVVADPELIPEVLADWARDPDAARRQPFRAAKPDVSDGVADEGPYGPILGRLKAAYDIDFQYYKQTTIIRRIERRLTSGSSPMGVEDYARKLAESRAELDQLFHELLIGVTQFFRDESAFRSLYESALVPQVLKLKPDEDLRIWCCACSTGEEAYTLAILAIEAFMQNAMVPRVRVLATDVHNASLQTASVGVYSAESLEHVPRHLRERYFVVQPGGGFKVSTELRRCVVFSPHNVLRDSAFTRMHVVSCRNLLIYFQPVAQTRAIAAFHTALLPNGAMMLGESEGVGELTDLFVEIERPARLYGKRPESFLPGNVRAMIATPSVPRLLQGQASGGMLEHRTVSRLYEQLLNRYAPTGLLVNGAGEVMHVFGDAGRYLQPVLGRFRSELGGLLTGALKTTVLIAVRRARESSQPVVFKNVSYKEEDGETMLTVTVDPFDDRTSGAMSFMIRLQEERPSDDGMRAIVAPDAPVIGAAASEHIQQLEAELQLARESLQHTVEELESANEELQAGNEELMASNEELQSTNEELHAVNEELYTVNAEHEIKIRELHEITADLNNLIRASDLATVFVDSAGRLRLFTPAAMAVFPIQQRDIGRDLRDFMPRASDPKLFDDLMEVIVSPRSIETEIRLHDGRVMKRRVTPYRDADNHISGAVLSYLDLTDQTRVREMLRDGQEEMRIFLDSAPVLAWAADSAGKVTRVSAHWVHFGGVAAEALTGDGWRVLVHPDDAATVGAAWERVAKSVGAVRCELRLRRRDGVYRWHELCALPVVGRDGEVQHWHGSYADVHDLRMSNEELTEAIASVREDNQLLNSTFSAAPTALLLVDGDGTIRKANTAAETLLGAHPRELLGASVDALVPHDVRGGHAALRERFLATRQTRPIGTGLELRVQRPNGTQFQADIGLASITVDGGMLTVVSVRDQTGSLQVQMEAEAAVRAKGTFLATMSHEIRTPLNAILGMTQLMLREPATPEQLDRLGRVEEASDHLLSIVNDVLDLAKVESGKLAIASEPFELATVVSESMAMIQESANAKNLVTSTVIAAGVPSWVRGDRRRVEQILVNYLNNALKFTPKGSVAVHVSATGKARGEVQLRFEVRDTGIGVALDQQQAIFQPFHQVEGTAKRSFGGTGLGLAICRELARAMKGDVGVESSAGEGSVFWFTVRVTRAGPDRSAHSAPAALAETDEQLIDRLANVRILLVEDDPVNQMVASEMIHAVTGQRPVIAGSGAEAVQHADGGRFDLVFMDMQMPGMDGIETTHRLRLLEGYADVPIIALTANAFEEDVKRCLEGGMDDHLAKPVIVESLRRIVTTWIPADGDAQRW